MWFTQTNGPLSVGRITPDGQVAFFAASTRDAALDIARGPGKDVWYTISGFPEIDRMNPSGKRTPFVVQGNPNDIVAGPDGNLWYTDFTLQAIGTIARTGGSFKEYTVPTQSAYPFDITAGPDGNLWFTELFGGKIGKITTAGVVTEYTIPGAAEPVGIASVAGNIYATDLANGAIVQSTTSGVLTIHRSPFKLHFNALVEDANGRLVVSAAHEGRIGLFNPTTHEYSSFLDVPKPQGQLDAGPDGMALSPKGEIWFTSSMNDYIGVVDDGP